MNRPHFALGLQSGIVAAVVGTVVMSIRGTVDAERCGALACAEVVTWPPRRVLLVYALCDSRGSTVPDLSRRVGLTPDEVLREWRGLRHLRVADLPLFVPGDELQFSYPLRGPGKLRLVDRWARKVASAWAVPMLDPERLDPRAEVLS